MTFCGSACSSNHPIVAFGSANVFGEHLGAARDGETLCAWKETLWNGGGTLDSGVIVFKSLSSNVVFECGGDGREKAKEGMHEFVGANQLLSYSCESVTSRAGCTHVAPRA